MHSFKSAFCMMQSFIEPTSSMKVVEFVFSRKLKPSFKAMSKLSFSNRFKAKLFSEKPLSNESIVFFDNTKPF